MGSEALQARGRWALGVARSVPTPLPSQVPRAQGLHVPKSDSPTSRHGELLLGAPWTLAGPKAGSF